MRVDRLLARARAMPLRARLLSLAAGMAVIVLAVLLAAATRDTRVPLFAAPLDRDQLSEVETRLAAWRVGYAPLADNVRVDARARADLVLRLGVAGVPHRHLATSTEAFAHVGALTPQSVLDVQARDALAADLEAGLRGLDGVADARVVIAPSSGGVYADEPARDATAAVRLTLTPGAHLTSATLEGIRAFVAGGVPGLDRERVTVLDDRGAIDEADADDASVQTSLQSALDAAFGSGTTIVRVHREPLGERRTDRDVKRAPLAGSLERSTGDERFASAKKTYAKLTLTEERGSETHDVVRVADANATRRLSVAVFVDGARLLDLDAIRALAAATTGIDTARGDVLRVEAVRFAIASAPPRGIDAWSIAGLIAGIVPHVALVAAAVTLVVVGARPVYALASRAVENAAARGAARESAGLPPARVRGVLVGEPPHVAAAVISALPAATATAVLELYPPDERAQIVRRLARAAVDLVPHAEELLRGRA